MTALYIITALACVPLAWRQALAFMREDWS